MSLHIFPFNVSRLGVIGRSMFDVHLFKSVLGKNSLALMGAKGRGYAEQIAVGEGLETSVLRSGARKRGW